jgi:hypothetical protein
MGKFTVKTGKDGQFYFNLKAGNGEIILASEGYTTKAACLNGIESVKKNASDASKFNKLVSKNEKPYFTLKAGNGEVIGNSEMYESVGARDNGIKSVMSNAPDAPTVEE